MSDDEVVASDLPRGTCFFAMRKYEIANIYIP